MEVAFGGNVDSDVELLKQGGSIATYATNAATPNIQNPVFLLRPGEESNGDFGTTEKVWGLAHPMCAIDRLLQVDLLASFASGVGCCW